MSKGGKGLSTARFCSLKRVQGRKWSETVGRIVLQPGAGIRGQASARTGYYFEPVLKATKV